MTTIPFVGKNLDQFSRFNEMFLMILTQHQDKSVTFEVPHHQTDYNPLISTKSNWSELETCLASAGFNDDFSIKNLKRKAKFLHDVTERWTPPLQPSYLHAR